ncbi:hypothetical protein L0F63_005960 [Massospora cicadina]|nr:hypothetical protein L0F63_005960 [Massospora cicadina]
MSSSSIIEFAPEFARSLSPQPIMDSSPVMIQKTDLRDDNLYNNLQLGLEPTIKVEGPSVGPSIEQSTAEGLDFKPNFNSASSTFHDINLKSVLLPGKTNLRPAFVPNFDLPRPEPIPDFDMQPLEKLIYSSQEYNEAHLLSAYPNTFKPPQRVDALAYSHEELAFLCEEVCVRQGHPLVLQNFHKLNQFNNNLFSLGWLQKHMQGQGMQIRDLNTNKDKVMKFENFIAENERRSPAYLYGKDMPCPQEWREAGNRIIPPWLQTLGTNDINGLLDLDIRIEKSDDLRCSSLWFMVARDNANNARRFWHQHGGGNTSLDQDNCPLPAHVIGTADFPVYVFEQRKGDLVIVSESAHQVVNVGKGCTIKYAWNRTTPVSLFQAVNSALPVYHRILKPETFRIKTTVEQAVLQHGRVLELDQFGDLGPREMELWCRDYRLLLLVYAEIVQADFAPLRDLDHAGMEVSPDTNPHLRKCDFCGLDIWNTWFHCGKCKSGHPSDSHGHDFCVSCVAVNRGCLHREALTLQCHRPIVECFRDLVYYSNLYNTSPRFAQLASFVKVPEYSISDFHALDPELCTPMVAALKAFRNIKSGESGLCHHCNVRRYLFDVVPCNECNRRFCHACLMHHYGLDPFLVARKDERCLVCRKRCNCRRCKDKPNWEPAPAATKPFVQTDHYQNYRLGYGLSYQPVGTRKTLKPNLVDYATFLSTKKPLKVAPKPEVNSNLPAPENSKAGNAAGRKRSHDVDEGVGPEKRRKRHP